VAAKDLSGLSSEVCVANQQVASGGSGDAVGRSGSSILYSTVSKTRDLPLNNTSITVCTWSVLGWSCSLEPLKMFI
jgi:hypothetical protein